LAASLLANFRICVATPAATSLHGLDQLAKLADAISGYHEPWAIIVLRTEECGSRRWEIRTASVWKGDQQVDLALDVMPAVDGQLTAIQLMISPRNSNLFRQICQNVCSLRGYRPVRAKATA
jgi:hypothetical protein